MYNIQVPSLAAFPPAYKTLKSPNPTTFEIETISLKEVDHMNEFFDLYRMEHRWLLEKEDPGIWDSSILASKDYLEYTRSHLLELTKSRFIPSDWPENLAILLESLSYKDLTLWSEMSEEDGNNYLVQRLKALEKGVSTRKGNHKIIDDFYLLKNGDELGKKQIPEDRIAFYEQSLNTIASKKHSKNFKLNAELVQFFGIFQKLYNSLPSDHFRIDLKNNTLERIED